MALRSSALYKFGKLLEQVQPADKNTPTMRRLTLSIEDAGEENLKQLLEEDDDDDEDEEEGEEEEDEDEEDLRPREPSAKLTDDESNPDKETLVLENGNGNGKVHGRRQKRTGGSDSVSIDLRPNTNTAEVHVLTHEHVYSLFHLFRLVKNFESDMVKHIRHNREKKYIDAEEFLDRYGLQFDRFVEYHRTQQEAWERALDLCTSITTDGVNVHGTSVAAKAIGVQRTLVTLMRQRREMAKEDVSGRNVEE